MVTSPPSSTDPPSGSDPSSVRLRAVRDEDVDVFFDQMQDPEAVRMAAFTPDDPSDRAAHDAHWARIRANPEIRNRTILVDDAVAGHVASFVTDGNREITYWVGREHWGRGVATMAVEAFIAEERERPLLARVAADNRGSIRVLEKCGFSTVDEARGYASARGAEIDELVMRLDRDEPSLYRELAGWWPLVSAPADYEEEAATYLRILSDALGRTPATILELGSGGGNNASHMKAHATLTLVDRSPDMVAVSRELNPGCEHTVGDLRSVRLGETFDAVFVHDAIEYVVTELDLRRAVKTAFVHCTPGGAVLFVPDHVRETFAPGTSHGGHDGDGRSLRYLEWTWDPDPIDSTYVVDYVFLLREGDGEVRTVPDRHVLGVFSRDRWLELLTAEGFVDARVERIEHTDVEGVHEGFVARRPAEG